MNTIVNGKFVSAILSSPGGVLRQCLSAAVCGLALLWTDAAPAKDLTLITLAPGHFHAALFQREMLPGIAAEAYVYAPLGPDLAAHLNRVAQFNLRKDQPTQWHLQVYTGPDFQERMLREKRGQIVVLSGRNFGKIDRIVSCVNAKLNVLADKPWMIEAEDMPKLEAALATADAKRVVAYDAMTERFEITCIIPRSLVADTEVFGQPLKGSPAEPAVTIESMHYLLKEVGGVPNLRPPWFFDVAQQGEGLSDVGTHLVDIVAWTLFPDQVINYRSDIQVLSGKRWPTTLSLAEFQRVTGEKDFPESLKPTLKDGKLAYYCNNSVDYTLCGVHVRLQPTWDFVAPPGKKDTEFVVYRGSRARVEVRQGAEEKYRREVFVVPNTGVDRAAVLTALQKHVVGLQKEWPGLAFEEQGAGFHLVIPERFRISHEEHFALVARRFLDFIRNPKAMPAWEKTNLLAKYYVTTKGVQLARQKPSQP
jgi:predicted dehydrogenase